MKLNRQDVVAFILTIAGAVFVASQTPTETATWQTDSANATRVLAMIANDTTTEPITRVTRSSLAEEATAGEPGTTKTVSLNAKRAKCLQKANLIRQSPTNFTCSTSLLVHNSLADFWEHHASPYMCQNRESHEDLIECALDATKDCLPRKNRLHFPDTTKVRRSLHYICDLSKARPTEVNITCGQSLFPQVFQCLHRDVLLVVGKSSLPGPIDPQLICRTYDIAVYCAWDTLQACGKVTAGAYTRIMALYLRPPSCPSSAISSKTSTVTLVLLVGLGLVLGGGVGTGTGIL